MNLITFLISAIKIIFLLGFLIFIHEGGHFLVAKACKIRVNEFAIGFGPTIWRKQGKETKYALRLIPLGGFVSMLGEAERSEEAGSFSKASIPKRIAVVLAGGLVNIIFGLLVYFILVSASGNYISTTIDTVIPEYSAEKVGIEQGDKILKIDGRTVRLRSDINKALQKSKNREMQITVERNGEIKSFYITPEEETDYKIGVTFKIAENTFTNNIYYGFWDTIDFSVSIIDNIKMLFSGEVGVDQLTGPVGISEVVSKTEGIKEFVYMLALISLSLGVTNLLPFPPLDGGKVVILIIEGIRRKPIKENVEIGVQLAGFCLLIGMSIYVTYNDILRIF